jgi:hypothetical protein
MSSGCNFLISTLSNIQLKNCQSPLGDSNTYILPEFGISHSSKSPPNKCRVLMNDSGGAFSGMTNAGNSSYMGLAHRIFTVFILKLVPLGSDTSSVIFFDMTSANNESLCNKSGEELLSLL